eukprot:m.130869 g.130869  ORF g.130869 m.130869 type:complete len:969 (+) comp13733_c0_seq1:66-2972(+)
MRRPSQRVVALVLPIVCTVQPHVILADPGAVVHSPHTGLESLHGCHRAATGSPLADTLLRPPWTEGGPLELAIRSEHLPTAGKKLQKLQKPRVWDCDELPAPHLPCCTTWAKTNRSQAHSCVRTISGPGVTTDDRRIKLIRAAWREWTGAIHRRALRHNVCVEPHPAAASRYTQTNVNITGSPCNVGAECQRLRLTRAEMADAARRDARAAVNATVGGDTRSGWSADWAKCAWRPVDLGPQSPDRRLVGFMRRFSGVGSTEAPSSIQLCGPCPANSFLVREEWGDICVSRRPGDAQHSTCPEGCIRQKPPGTGCVLGPSGDSGGDTQAPDRPCRALKAIPGWWNASTVGSTTTSRKSDAGGTEGEAVAPLRDHDITPVGPSEVERRGKVLLVTVAGTTRASTNAVLRSLSNPQCPDIMVILYDDTWTTAPWRGVADRAAKAGVRFSVVIGARVLQQKQATTPFYPKLQFQLQAVEEAKHYRRVMLWDEDVVLEHFDMAAYFQGLALFGRGGPVVSQPVLTSELHYRNGLQLGAQEETFELNWRQWITATVPGAEAAFIEQQAPFLDARFFVDESVVKVFAELAVAQVHFGVDTKWDTLLCGVAYQWDPTRTPCAILAVPALHTDAMTVDYRSSAAVAKRFKDKDEALWAYITRGVGSSGPENTAAGAGIPTASVVSGESSQTRPLDAATVGVRALLFNPAGRPSTRITAILNASVQNGLRLYSRVVDACGENGGMLVDDGRVCCPRMCGTCGRSEAECGPASPAVDRCCLERTEQTKWSSWHPFTVPMCAQTSFQSLPCCVSLGISTVHKYRTKPDAAKQLVAKLATRQILAPPRGVQPKANIDKVFATNPLNKLPIGMHSVSFLGEPMCRAIEAAYTRLRCSKQLLRFRAKSESRGLNTTLADLHPTRELGCVYLLIEYHRHYGGCGVPLGWAEARRFGLQLWAEWTLGYRCADINTTATPPPRANV